MNPNKPWSLIIDGMDQAKHNLPHFNTSTKVKSIQLVHCFVEIVTTSQSINELNYFPNCDTLQARQPFGNYSVLLYLYFTVIIFLIRLLCVTYRFRTTLTKNKQQFETHGFGCVSQQNIHVLNIILECFRILNASVIGSSLRKKLTLRKHRCRVVPHKHQRCTRSHWHNSHRTSMYLHKDLADATRCEHQFIIRCFDIIAFHCYTFSSGRRRCMEIKNASHRCSCQPETRSPCVSWFMRVPPWF